MKNTWISLDHYPVSGAVIIYLRKLHTSADQTPELVSKIPELGKNLMTGLFCRCAGNAIGFSTRLGKIIFGKILTRYWSHSHFTQSVEIMPKARRSFKRHFGIK